MSMRFSFRPSSQLNPFAPDETMDARSMSSFHTISRSCYIHTPSIYPSAAYTTSNGRPYNHDRFFHPSPRHNSPPLYLVADGHGSHHTGHLVAHYITSNMPKLLQQQHARSITPNILRQIIARLDSMSIALTHQNRTYAGSTLCAVLCKEHVLYCANVGDSRAVLIGAREVWQLSTDHLCDSPSERRRIEAAGGVVVGGLLNGYISMSRAIGDDDLKSHRNLTPFPVNPSRKYQDTLFTSEPDIRKVPLTENHLMLVIASDGVWSKLSNKQVAATARSLVVAGYSLESIARKISERAISKGSRDNVTCIAAYMADPDVVRANISKATERKRGTGIAEWSKRRDIPKRRDVPKRRWFSKPKPTVN